MEEETELLSNINTDTCVQRHTLGVQTREFGDCVPNSFCANIGGRY